jgi:hypothetical protein
MPLRAPISHHLDLYRYWLAKRGFRSMPARSEINPADIPELLPYLIIVDKVDGQFRYRLVGTAVAREFGRDMTGSFVGSYLTAPEAVAAVRAVYERVFAAALPVVVKFDFKAKSGAIHNISQLVLPLWDGGADVNIAVSTVIARFDFGVTASTDWLKGAPVKVHDVIDVHDTAELEERCLEWERYCDEQWRLAEGIAEREQQSGGRRLDRA